MMPAAYSMWCQAVFRSSRRSQRLHQGRMPMRALVGLMAVGSLFSGCESVGGLFGTRADVERPTADAAADTDVSSSDDPAAAEAEAYARRVAAGLEALARGQSDKPEGGGHVVWLDEGRDAGTDAKIAMRDTETPSVRVLRDAAVAVPAPDDEPPRQAEIAVRDEEPEAPPLPDRRELVAALAAAIAREPGSASDKALRAAALGMLGADGRINEAALAGLDAQTAALARGYAQLVRALADQMAADGTLDREAVARRLEAMYGPRELRIKRFELCKRVQSYGVFDPIESRSLLAGQPHRMGLYVELDHFASHELSPGQYEVKLQQEVELFNMADGLAVWRQPMVQIVDQSRNVRRDFFTWQVVELPSRLTVGRYILKVRVTDVHAQMISEDAVELNIVADPALAAGMR